MLVTGCNVGSSSAPAPTPPPTPSPVIHYTEVSGAVFAGGPIYAGGVAIYDFSTGTKGKLLVADFVSTKGSYKLSVPNIPSVILVEIGSGCYSEKATPWVPVESGNSGMRFYNGKPLSQDNMPLPDLCPAVKLSTAVTVTTGVTPLVVGVTPYTHAAVGLAEYLHRTGETVSAAVNDANTKLSQLVGVDVVKTLPAEPTRNSMLSNSNIYGALLAGIPSWIFNVPGNKAISPLSSLNFAEAMKVDLAQDGVLNGVGRDALGNTVSVAIGGIPLTTDIYRHQVALYSIFRFRSETEGAWQPFATNDEIARIIDFLPALNSYNKSSSSIFDSSSVIGLDIQGPIIELDGPLEGAVMSDTYNGYISGRIHSNVGVNGNFVGGYIDGSGRTITDGHASNVVVLVDGVYIYTIKNSNGIYNFSSFLQPSYFSNGPHVVGLKVTNNLGQTSSVSVNVIFSN